MAQFASVIITFNQIFIGDKLSMQLDGSLQVYTSTLDDTGNAAAAEFNSLITPVSANYSYVFAGNQITIIALNYGDQFTFNAFYFQIPPADVTFIELPNINPVNPIDPEISIIDNPCNGDFLGSIEIIEITGGFPNYEVSIQDDLNRIDPFLESNVTGVTPLLYENLPAGSYSILILDQLFNPFFGFSDSVNVGQPDPLVIDAFVSINGDTLITIFGGVEPYTPQWDDLGFPGALNRNLAPGDYLLTVTDVNGCIATAAFKISAPSAFFSSNPIFEKIEDDDGLITLELYAGSGNDFNLISTFKQPIFNDETVFRLERILATLVNEHVVSFNQNTIVQSIENSIEYYVKYTGSGNADYVQTNALTAYRGGLSFEQYAFRNEKWLVYLNQFKPFFSWSPNNLEVYKDQPIYLLYFNSANQLEANMMVSIFYENETSIIYNHEIISEPVALDLYAAPAGYAMLGLSSYEEVGNPIVSYSIYFETDLNELLSEIKTYIIRNDVKPNIMYFIFENSLGGHDSLTTFGFPTRRLKTSQDVFKINLAEDYAVEPGDAKTENKSADDVRTFSTQPIDKALMDSYVDFTISNNVYAVMPGYLMRVSINDATFVIDDSFKNIYTLKFACTFPTVQKYTPEL